MSLSHIKIKLSLSSERINFSPEQVHFFKSITNNPLYTAAKKIFFSLFFQHASSTHLHEYLNQFQTEQFFLSPTVQYQPNFFSYIRIIYCCSPSAFPKFHLHRDSFFKAFTISFAALISFQFFFETET